MREIAYAVRGFLTVRKDSLRVPLNGSLTIHADPRLRSVQWEPRTPQATVSRTVLGASLFSAIVQIEAEPPVIGGVDHEGRMLAMVTVEAVIAAVHAAGRTLISGGSCRTTTQAIVPLRSKPGFDLERGGRLVGRYHRPPFTGCGWSHSACQPLGGWSRERRRHRSHPAHILKGDRIRLTSAPSRRGRGHRRGGTPSSSSRMRQGRTAPRDAHYPRYPVVGLEAGGIRPNPKVPVGPVAATVRSLSPPGNKSAAILGRGYLSPRCRTCLTQLRPARLGKRLQTACDGSHRSPPATAGDLGSRRLRSTGMGHVGHEARARPSRAGRDW